jgi:hypothetical protein
MHDGARKYPNFEQYYKENMANKKLKHNYQSIEVGLTWKLNT